MQVSKQGHLRTQACKPYENNLIKQLTECYNDSKFNNFSAILYGDQSQQLDKTRGSHDEPF